MSYSNWQDVPMYTERQLQQGVEVIRKSERERIREGARGLKFTLFRPSGGPAHGQSLDVVPLAELEALIGGDGD